MSCDSLYTPELRTRGFRMTAQRRAILHVLHHSGRHLSPAEVFELARRDAPGLTYPTVYRTLEFLAKTGLAVPAQVVGKKKLAYQIARESHHHLICRSCGSSLEVGLEALEPAIRNLEQSSGYRFISSHITLYGLCPKCQNKPNRNP